MSQKPADAELSSTTLARIQASIPPATRRAYESDIRCFREWCEQQGRTTVPASPQTLAEYVATLADEGKAVSTINRALAAIADAHRSDQHQPPSRHLAARVLRDHARDLADQGRSTRKAPPLDVEAIKSMLGTLDLNTPIGLRDRALLLVGFGLGARRSELAALNVRDINFLPQGVCVTIRRSKTDRNSKGRQVPLPTGANPDTCPVNALKEWIAILPAGRTRADGPLFVRIDRHGRLGHVATGRGHPDGRITGETVAAVVRRAATRAGLDAAQTMSGHSLRRGFATAAYSMPGADLVRIARHGGWKENSATFYGYLEEVDGWQRNPLTNLGL